MTTCCCCGKQFKEGTGEPVIVNDKKAERSYPGELCPVCSEKLTPRWVKNLHNERRTINEK